MGGEEDGKAEDIGERWQGKRGRKGRDQRWKGARKERIPSGDAGRLQRYEGLANAFATNCK